MATTTITRTQPIRAFSRPKLPTLKSKISAARPKPGQIPVVDFSDFLSGDETRVNKCLDVIRDACMEHGFFQITNHGIARETQLELVKAGRDFFALSSEEKMKLDQSQNNHNRGYQTLLAQKYEATDTAPDLKEGFYVGPELPWEHPAVVAGKFAHGPNYWPEPLGKPFQETCMDYLNQITDLSKEVLRAVALSLDEDNDEFFEEFLKDPITYFKMNHYPKPPTTNDIGQKGHGAHKDFGFITLLLQDENAGLEVWDEPVKGWIQVPPTAGAYVVNMGNLLQRWTNDVYISNIHRVINHSGAERLSVAHLFHGNPDYIIRTKESCINTEDGGNHYGPVRVDDFIRGKYDEVYNMAGIYGAPQKE